MNKIVDLAFCALLAIGATGHLIGSFLFTTIGSVLFVWSLSGVLAAGLLVAVNLLRSLRLNDRALARIALVGNLCWLVVVILFGLSTGDVFDARVLLHGFAALGLSYFSISNLLSAQEMAPQS